MRLPQVCLQQRVVQTVERMLSPKLPTENPILLCAYEDTDGEIFFIHEDNFEIGDMVEATVEDWKLPPSIEDEEAMVGGRSSGKTLEGSKRHTR
jgi:hypothetical protein